MQKVSQGRITHVLPDMITVGIFFLIYTLGPRSRWKWCLVGRLFLDLIDCSRDPAGTGKKVILWP